MGNVIGVVIILLGVAFYTLFERKYLSVRQTRIGPNKLSLKGVFQPLLDGIKLLIKEFVKPSSFMVLFLISPVFSFVVILVLWLSLPSSSRGLFLSLLFLLIVMGVGVYFIMLSG